ncbi:MAG: TorF family putative porin, partial [Pseudomonadota bacterium]
MKTSLWRSTVAATVFATTGLATLSVAHAEGEYSANIGVASEYVWRGVTQSDESPSIWGGV